MTEQTGCGGHGKGQGCCGGHGHGSHGHGHGGHGGCGCGGKGKHHGVRTDKTPQGAPDDISGGRRQLGLRGK